MIRDCQIQKIVFLVTTTIFTETAAAAPPPDCARKFIGQWRHHGIMGQTNNATLTADGQAICSGNPACVQGTWTCSGNELIYNNGMYNTVYTLQPNGTMTARGGIVVTRLGRAPTESRNPANNSQTTYDAAVRQEPGLKKGPPISFASAVRTLEWQALDILKEINAAEIRKWREDNADDVKKEALGRRLIDMRSTLDRAAAEGRWEHVRRLLPPFKRLAGEYKAMKAAAH